ncbi:MAG: outer membrane protein assembly factor BamD [Candidatus Binatia bacterium]
MILKFPFCNLPFAILIFLAAGCSYMPSLPWSKPALEPNPTAEAIFKQGMDNLKNKKYARAILQFERIRDEFPFSPEAPEAELKIAEAYYLNKQYPEATLAFKNYLGFHPTSKKAPFVIYHLGLVQFDQFTSIDRDQKNIKIAKGYFETIIRDHPNSSYAAKAKEKLAKSREYLAEHEFYIGSFYYREKNYLAARDRFEEIIRRYRDTPTAVKALYHLGESYRLERNAVKAALAYEALIQHYPDSSLAKKARMQLAQLDKENVDPLAMLLMPEGRPSYIPPPESNETQNPQSEI